MWSIPDHHIPSSRFLSGKQGLLSHHEWPTRNTLPLLSGGVRRIFVTLGDSPFMWSEFTRVHSITTRQIFDPADFRHMITPLAKESFTPADFSAKSSWMLQKADLSRAIRWKFGTSDITDHWFASPLGHSTDLRTTASFRVSAHPAITSPEITSFFWMWINSADSCVSSWLWFATLN
jgi:hypothetical protein